VKSAKLFALHLPRRGDEASRIGSSTYLAKSVSDRKLKLITAFNISFVPT
jgi:hypothetical protein